MVADLFRAGHSYKVYEEKEMKSKRALLIFVLCLIFIMPSIALGKTRLYSDKELTKISDLVVEGKVVKLEASGKTKDIYGLKGRMSYATIEISKIIKGKTDSTAIIIEFVRFNDFMDGKALEEDCQDAQFPLGAKGVAYLKMLPDGHYSSCAGWCQGFKESGK